MESSKWKGIVEALLFASGDVGLSISQMASVLDITELQVMDIMESLKEDYAADTRGIHVVEMAGVFQLATKKAHSDYLKKLIESTNKHGLSQAALETLAIVAYKQPITRVEIEEIRGVKTESPLHTLVSKVLIKEVGRAEGAGRAYLYGTTKEFLDYFGLKSLEELPKITNLPEDNYETGEADLFFEKFQQSIE